MMVRVVIALLRIIQQNSGKCMHGPLLFVWLMFARFAQEEGATQKCDILADQPAFQTAFHGCCLSG